MDKSQSLNLTHYLLFDRHKRWIKRASEERTLFAES